jgi:hypothetical protein
MGNLLWEWKQNWYQGSNIDTEYLVKVITQYHPNILREDFDKIFKYMGVLQWMDEANGK